MIRQLFPAGFFPEPMTAWEWIKLIFFILIIFGVIRFYILDIRHDREIERKRKQKRELKELRRKEKAILAQQSAENSITSTP